MPAISKAMSLGTAPRVVISAGVGAVTGVAGDSANKTVNGDSVTFRSMINSAVAGSAGGAFKNPVTQSIMAEGIGYILNLTPDK